MITECTRLNSRILPVSLGFKYSDKVVWEMAQFVCGYFFPALAGLVCNCVSCVLYSLGILP